MDVTPLAPPSKRPPPRIQRILKYLKLRKAGTPLAEAPWRAYQLKNREFDELQRWLKQDEDLWGYVEDKVRYDYDSGKGSLVSRRPTTLHSFFMASVVREITWKLHDIAENGDFHLSRNFAGKIQGMGSSRIDLLGTEEQEGRPKMRRDPDFSFRHLDARWPGIVLELSYPLKRRALPHLADDYILETNGSISKLVGLDLDTDTKKGTISIWQPVFKRNEEGSIFEMEAALVRDADVFRDENGDANPDPDSGLHLDLEDFGPLCLTADLVSKVPIFIDSVKLCSLLAEAEAFHFEMETDSGKALHKPEGLRFRKRRRAEMESNAEAPESEAADCDSLAIRDRSAQQGSESSRDEGTEIINFATDNTIKEEQGCFGT